MPSLILIKSPGGAGGNLTFELTAPATVIGREDSCDIVVQSTAVSRRHARITRGTDGQYYVEDLNSRNGITVNNEPVAQMRALRHEDRIKICDFLYRFNDERAAPRGLLSGFDSGSRLAPPEPEEQSQSTIEHKFAARTTDRLLDVQPTERLRALLDISTALSRTLDLNALLDTIAVKVMEVFRQADRCFVILRDEVDRLTASMVKVRRSGGADDDQRFSRTIVRRAIETGEAYLSEDASSDTNLGAAMSVAEFRIRSVMCVPLATPDGTPIGALQVDTQDRIKKFRSDDLELLAIAANLAAVAVDKARLHEAAIERQKQQNEIELARSVQLGFLPQAAPLLPGYEFFHHYSAALTVGGDYYDFVPLADGRLAVLLGDVAGKGVPASLLMAKLSAEARFCLLTQPDLALAIRALNEQLIRGGIGDRFVTLAAAVIDPIRHTASIVNAGHIAPLIFRSGTLTDAVDAANASLPLGIMSGLEYVAAERSFEPGDTLLIFSDGVTDAMDPSEVMFDLEGVRRVLNGEMSNARPATVGERVMKAVKTHSAGRAQNDDIAFVCFGRVVDNAPTKAKDTDTLHPPAQGITAA